MARTTVTVSFTLDPQADRDIVRWLERLERGKKSAAIRAAIRDHLRRNGVTVGDVYQAVKDLERKLKAGAFVVSGDGSTNTEEWDEPPEAAAALDALAQL